MTRRYSILLVFGLAMLSGCSFLTRSYQSPEVTQAEALLQNGKNKEAAAIYKRLADAPSSQQNQYRLLAADALIKANDLKQAKKYLAMIDVSTFAEPQFNHLKLVEAQIDLSQGNAETALTRLNVIKIESLNDQTKIAYYQSLAFAYSLTGDIVASAQALTNLDALTLEPKTRYKNYEQILSTLTVLSKENLIRKQSQADETLQGWMSLARVFKLGDANLTSNIANWRKLYPAHPGNSAFLAEYVKNYQNNLARSGLFAVFLPESGPYSAPAAVIKNGFMKAYQLAKKTGSTNSEIRFYDTEKNSSTNLYQQAVKDGARLVVGPLDKKDIKSLVDNTELTIPVLALNHVEGLTHPKLYQFGLSPIDDAEQITVKAHHDGHRNALFLVPQSEQGKRIGGYFSDNWQKLGGKTAALKSYDDKATDYSKLAQQIMQQKSAEELIDADADAIIINVYAKPARLLYPQLHKNKATAHLPVYATSQIYLGDPDPIRDKELEGVTFCDVPWVFNQAYPGDLSKFFLHDSWQNLSPSYLRLLPMGIDAYNLIGHLNQLKSQSYSGATGRLKLDADNRIARELFCATFVDGFPKPINFASENAVLEAPPASKLPDSASSTTEQNKSGLDNAINLPLPSDPDNGNKR